MRSICLWGCILLTSACVADERADLAGALTFHVSFDRSVEADFAKGDAKLYTAQSMKRTHVRPGLHRDDVVVEPNDGRYGGPLWFKEKSEQLIYDAGGENLPGAKPQGQLSGEQRISWSRGHVVIMLGINYVGRMDDLAVFDRELSPPEVKQLHALPMGIKSIRQQALN